MSKPTVSRCTARSGVPSSLLRDWRPRGRCAAFQPTDSTGVRCEQSLCLCHRPCVHLVVWSRAQLRRPISGKEQTDPVSVSAHDLSRHHLTPPSLDTSVAELWVEGHRMNE